MKWAALLLGCLGLDVVSKWLALQWVPALSGSAYPFGGLAVFKAAGITFSLNYVVNTGAAWGLFSEYGMWLTLLRLGIIASLLWWAPRGWPVALILAGAVGNVLDMALYGHVIDFFHFTFWGYSFPVFNVADSCICAGVGALLLWPDAKRVRV